MLCGQIWNKGNMKHLMFQENLITNVYILSTYPFKSQLKWIRYVAFKRLLFISCQTLDFLYVYQDFTPQFSSSKSFVDRLNLRPPKSNIIIFLLHGGVKALFVHTSPRSILNLYLIYRIMPNSPKGYGYGI